MRPKLAIATFKASTLILPLHIKSSVLLKHYTDDLFAKIRTPPPKKKKKLKTLIKSLSVDWD